MVVRRSGVFRLWWGRCVISLWMQRMNAMLMAMRAGAMGVRMLMLGDRGERWLWA